MAKWLINFSEIKLGNKKIMEKMLSANDTLNSGELIDYGNGLGITTYKNLNVALHSGHDAFYRAADMYFPQYNVGIAILSNYYDINPFKYGFEISDIVLKDFIQDEQKEVRENDLKDEVKEDKIVISPAELSNYQGSYLCKDLGVRYDLSVRNGTLIANFWRNDEVVLTPKRRDVFSGNQYWFSDITFVRGSNNKIEGFVLSSGNVRNFQFILIDL